MRVSVCIHGQYTCIFVSIFSTDFWLLAITQPRINKMPAVGRELLSWFSKSIFFLRFDPAMRNEAFSYVQKLRHLTKVISTIDTHSNLYSKQRRIRSVRAYAHADLGLGCLLFDKTPFTYNLAHLYPQVP